MCIVSPWAQAAALAPAPFFLYLAFQNVHWPLEAPQPYLDRFANTTGGDARRQAVAAMAAILDDGVRNVTDALKRGGDPAALPLHQSLWPPVNQSLHTCMCMY